MRHWGLPISFTVGGFNLIYCCCCSSLDSELQQNNNNKQRVCNKCQLWQVASGMWQASGSGLGDVPGVPCRAVLDWFGIIFQHGASKLPQLTPFSGFATCVCILIAAPPPPPRPPAALALPLSSSSSAASSWQKTFAYFRLAHFKSFLFSILFLAACGLHLPHQGIQQFSTFLLPLLLSPLLLLLLLLLCTFRLLESLE